MARRVADRSHHRAWHRRVVGLGRKPILARRRLLLTRLPTAVPWGAISAAAFPLDQLVLSD
jgi:hypothetical protein